MIPDENPRPVSPKSGETRAGHPRSKIREERMGQPPTPNLVDWLKSPEYVSSSRTWCPEMQGIRT